MSYSRVKYLLYFVVGLCIVGLIAAIVVVSVQLKSCELNGTVRTCAEGMGVVLEGNTCVATEVVRCGCKTKEENGLCVKSETSYENCFCSDFQNDGKCREAKKVNDSTKVTEPKYNANDCCSFVVS